MIIVMATTEISWKFRGLFMEIEFDELINLCEDAHSPRNEKSASRKFDTE